MDLPAKERRAPVRLGLAALGLAGHIRAAAIPLCAVFALLATLSSVSADPAKTGYPNSMAATGDSITVAATTCGGTNCPAYSWSTGTDPAVNSHYSRILAANSLVSGNNFNNAVSGTKMGALNGQAVTVNAQNVDYVTMLAGANDICNTPGEATMTSVATYRAQFQTGMNTLSAGSPDARFFVASVPDVYHLWSILHTDPAATARWSASSICQAMLANPTSFAQADIDRRDRVRQRIVDYNTQLQEVCAQYIHCRFDNNAAFNWAFTVSDITTTDYFHPSIQGQAGAASVTYGATFDFTESVAPSSTATSSPAGGGISVSLIATDNVAVSGIEYRIGAGAWARYTAPVFVADGATITYRAVDVNGNIEATHSLTASPLPDGDADGFLDGSLAVHTGPANLNTATDNCVGIANSAQLNSDGNFIDQTPPSTQDDKTWPMSDAAGDACDPDDDNDGLLDTTESGGPPCPSASAVTSVVTADTDGDRILDGAECTLGTNPNDNASKPSPAQCGPSADADGDRLSDRAEVCGYNTSPANTDTDGDRTLDGARDGCEAASFNGDRAVNSGDQLLLVLEILREPTPSLRLVGYDANKDGAVNSGDQLLVVQFFSPTGQCP
jgi:lysophospholipase L1-like esterase